VVVEPGGVVGELVVGQDAGGGLAVFLAGPLVVRAVQPGRVGVAAAAGWPQWVIRSAKVPGSANVRLARRAVISAAMAAARAYTACGLIRWPSSSPPVAQVQCGTGRARCVPPRCPQMAVKMWATIKICPLARPDKLACSGAADGEFLLAGA
jgi:hypothetical protein